MRVEYLPADAVGFENNLTELAVGVYQKSDSGDLFVVGDAAAVKITKNAKYRPPVEDEEEYDIEAAMRAIING